MSQVSRTVTINGDVQISGTIKLNQQRAFRNMLIDCGGKFTSNPQYYAEVVDINYKFDNLTQWQLFADKWEEYEQIQEYHRQRESKRNQRNTKSVWQRVLGIFRS